MSRMGWERAEDWEEQEQYESEASLRGRIFFVRLLVVVVFGFYLSYVIFLQQQRGEELTELAIGNQLATLTTVAPRGVIFDRFGVLLAENLPSFDVAITPAFLPSDDGSRQAVYERLSLLTSVPITNTLQQQQLLAEADAETVGTTSQLAELFGENAQETLDEAGVVPQLPDSIAGVVRTFSFDQYNPQVITNSVPITLARVVQQESIYMPGVQVLPRPIRNYPSGEYTAHLIGFMGPLPDNSFLDRGYELDDRVGLFGLESSMETFLAGQKGVRTVEVDATGRAIREIGTPTEPVAGYNLHLTLDAELQQIAHDALIAQLERKRNDPSFAEFPEVEQGAVVAIDPKTGEILALVNVPSFDNNRFATEIPVEYYLQLARDDYQPLFNNAIGGQYPPGSVFKVVTGAAALQEGIVSPSRRLLAPGSIVIPNRFAPNDPGRSQRFVCWIWNGFDAETGERGQHVAMNMYSAMAESCDIYFYKVAGGFSQGGEAVDPLGVNRLAVYANQFGFGRIQGIELPAEAPGNMPTEAWKVSNLAIPWSTGDDYNTAIGQGFVTSTPMQVAQMAAVIANGGFLYQPTLVHHFTDADGNVVLFGENDEPIFASLGENGIPILRDISGNILSAAEANVTVQFDEEGNYIRPPQLLNVVDVDRENIDVIAEGMRLVTQPGGTAGFLGECREDSTGLCVLDEEGRIDIIPWIEKYGIVAAGKTGTAEYCDNIALERNWCRAPGSGLIQPTHAWYVGYAPYDDPEIVVAAFIFNGGEGSIWAGGVTLEVMRAYFGVEKYAGP